MALSPRADFDRMSWLEEPTPAHFLRSAGITNSPKDGEFRVLLKENAVVQRIVVGREEIIQIVNHFVILRVNARQHV